MRYYIIQLKPDLLFAGFVANSCGGNAGARLSHFKDMPDGVPVLCHAQVISETHINSVIEEIMRMQPPLASTIHLIEVSLWQESFPNKSLPRDG